MDLENAIKFAINGKALLILGAGFSSGIKNISGKDIPFGDDLKKTLCDEVGINSNELELQEAAELYMDSPNLGKEKLVSLLKNAFTVNPALWENDKFKPQDYIASLPWFRIYTTNYDNVFESASARISKSRTPVTPSYDVENYIRSNPVIHINGYIESLDPSKLLNEFKLSSSSYLLDSFQQTDWFHLLRADIENASAIVFVGVSFKYDLDLQRVIYNAPEFYNKILFIDKEIELEKAHIDITKKKFGVIEYIGIERFAEEIERISQNYEPDTEDTIFECFVRPSQSTAIDIPRNIESSDLRHLLVKGLIDNDLLFLNKKNDLYLFHRKEEGSILNDIQNDSYKCYCVTSGLANGKTCFINMLSFSLLEKGWDVFKFNKENYNLSSEITSLQKNSKKTVIIIESYYLHLEILKKLRPCLYGNVILILTARTTIHYSVQHRLPNITGLDQKQICEINLDVLSNGDISKMADLLVRADFMLSNRGSSNGTIERILRKQYESQMSIILLEELKSEKVKNEISNLFTEVEKDPHARDLALASFILNTLGVDISVNSLLSLLDLGNLSQEILNNDNLRQLLIIQNGEIKTRSSTFAKFVLHEMGARHIIRLLLIMNKNAGRLVFEGEIDQIRSTLVSYSNINLLYPNKRRTKSSNEEIMEYYYSMGQAHFYDNNPFFWLQYSIASMEIADYKRAESTLKQAYSCADKLTYTFDTFQIDTQKARFLLYSTMAGYDPGIDPFWAFCEANTLLLKASNSYKGELVQVITQVNAYRKYYDTFKSKFTTTEKNMILREVNVFLEKIENYNTIQRKKNRPLLIDKYKIKNLEDLKLDILSSAISDA